MPDAANSSSPLEGYNKIFVPLGHEGFPTLTLVDGLPFLAP